MNKQTKTVSRGASLLLGILLILGVVTLSGCSNGNSSSLAAGASSGSSSSASSVSQAAPASSSEGSGASAAESKVSTKKITLEVVHKDGSKKAFDITTEEENLRAALEQEKLVEGEESSYGLFVKTVDGETVNDADQEWWCLTKGGEVWSNGVDATELSDGDAYEFTFTVGY